MFVRAVARNRSVKIADVTGGFGEGRVVGATQAVKLGMADRVESMEQTLSRLGAGGGVISPRSMRGDADGMSLRMRARRLWLACALKTGSPAKRGGRPAGSQAKVGRMAALAFFRD